MTKQKILIIGSHGNIGNILLQKLSGNSDCIVTGMVRKEEHLEEFNKSNLKGILGNLHLSVEELSRLFNLILSFFPLVPVEQQGPIKH